MSKIIEINELEKSYGKIKALDKISFSVDKGIMFGLVGPDGAGKTTMIRILCGLINFDKGDINILEKNIKNELKIIKNEIGYLSQKFSLYGDLTVDENIEFFAEIHNVKSFKERRDELLSFTRLKEFRNRLADNLSGGMKQKLALTCTLIHKPKIIFLDEPTTGVDPVSRRDFWKILMNLQRDGITIFMSTPYLDEAERCNYIALINKGKLIATDTPQNVKALVDKTVFEIICHPVRDAFKILKSRTDIEVQLFGDRINIMLDEKESSIDGILHDLANYKIEIVEKRNISISLENVFIHLIEKNG